MDNLKNKKLAFFVLILPMIIAVIYYIFFAKDRYVSMAQIAVRQVGGSDAPQIPGLAVMLNGVNPTSREETLYLREYLRSQDMLDVLQKKLGWASHYSSNSRDPLFWLSETAPQEDVLEYYRRLVRTHFDEQTGLLAVEVQSFDPRLSREILEVMLGESERFINEISHKMAREQMSFAKNELTKAREEYEGRRDALLSFQSENNMLDAEEAAKARASVISEIEANLTKERTTLKGLAAVLDKNTPQIRQQLNKIKALEQQLVSENKRLISEKSGDKLNVVASLYRNLTIDATIAEEAYKYAVSAVESARVEASKKLRSLVTVVSPNSPDKAIYPEKLYNLVTLFIGLLVLYGICVFVIATIEDHRD